MTSLSAAWGIHKRKKQKINHEWPAHFDETTTVQSHSALLATHWM
jgi:hypothetical protein